MKTYIVIYYPHGTASGAGSIADVEANNIITAEMVFRDYNPGCRVIAVTRKDEDFIRVAAGISAMMGLSTS